MDRRTFLSGCTAAAALAGGATTAVARSDEPVAGLFADAPLKISMPLSWFRGKTVGDKLEQIAAWGFPAYEWLGPTGDLVALRAAMDRTGLELSCIGGAGAIAPRQMVDPTDHDRVVEQFRERIKVAHQLGCRTLIGLTGNERMDVSHEEQDAHVVQCLERLAPIAEAEGVTLVLEALNVLVDHAGYYLTRTAHTMRLLEAVDSPNVKMCFDIYHQQITEGNVIRNLTANIGRIGHFHVGDNPGRKQPGTGELNYKSIFKAIHDTGYAGFVALECGKRGRLEDALAYLRDCLTWA